MPRYYVEKNGEWNIFSTIVDDFILDEFVCLDVLKARLLYERYKELTEDIDSLLTDKPNVNVMNYEEAIKRRKEQTEPQTEKVWNAGYKTGYDKGYKDAQKVKNSQDLVKDLVKDELQTEPNLILPERMERGEWYEVGGSIVVMNSEDYYDLLCKSWGKDEPQTNADQHTQHVGSVEQTDCPWK